MEFRDEKIMGSPESVPEIERLIPRIPRKEEDVNLKAHLDRLAEEFGESLRVFEKLKREDKLKVKDDFIDRIDNVHSLSKFGHKTWEKKRKKLESIREQVARYN